MNEVSSFVLKKFRSVLIGKKKKIDFGLSKYQICFVEFFFLIIEKSDMFYDK